jgi:hypothetical protein
MFSFDMAESFVLPFSSEPSSFRRIYTLSSGRLHSSKLDLMEEDHSLQVLGPMQNPVVEVVFQ